MENPDGSLSFLRSSDGTVEKDVSKICGCTRPVKATSRCKATDCCGGKVPCNEQCAPDGNGCVCKQDFVNETVAPLFKGEPAWQHISSGRMGALCTLCGVQELTATVEKLAKRRGQSKSEQSRNGQIHIWLWLEASRRWWKSRRRCKVLRQIVKHVGGVVVLREGTAHGSEIIQALSSAPWSLPLPFPLGSFFAGG